MSESCFAARSMRRHAHKRRLAQDVAGRRCVRCDPTTKHPARWLARAPLVASCFSTRLSLPKLVFLDGAGGGRRGSAYHTAETDAASDATRMMPMTRADACCPMHCAAAPSGLVLPAPLPACKDLR